MRTQTYFVICGQRHDHLSVKDIYKKIKFKRTVYHCYAYNYQWEFDKPLLHIEYVVLEERENQNLGMTTRITSLSLVIRAE